MANLHESTAIERLSRDELNWNIWNLFESIRISVWCNWKVAGIRLVQQFLQMDWQGKATPTAALKHRNVMSHESTNTLSKSWAKNRPMLSSRIISGQQRSQWTQPMTSHPDLTLLADGFGRSKGLRSRRLPESGIYYTYDVSLFAEAESRHRRVQELAEQFMFVHENPPSIDESEKIQPYCFSTMALLTTEECQALIRGQWNRCSNQPACCGQKVEMFQPSSICPFDSSY